MIGCTRSWSSDTPEDFIVIVNNVINFELFFKAWKTSGNESQFLTRTKLLKSTYVMIKAVIMSSNSTRKRVKWLESARRRDMPTGRVGREVRHDLWQDLLPLIQNSNIFSRHQKVCPNIISTICQKTAFLFGISISRNDQNHTYISHDTSSAAITASALLELHEHTNNELYYKTDRKIINSLFSPKYRADGQPNYKIPALFLNGTTLYKIGDYDTSIIYGDYYSTKSIRYFSDNY